MSRGSWVLISRRLAGLTLALLALVVPGLEAATYYVATSGGGSCSTNSASPSGNVSASLGCLTPGDTLYFLAGTYDVSVVNPPSGTSSNRVTIAGLPGARPVMRNSGAGEIFHFQGSSVNYITLDNFVMDGANHNVVMVRMMEGAHHIRVQNSEFFGSVGSAILAGGTGNEYINNHIHDLGTTDLDHGIYQVGDNTLMLNNHIHHIPGFGLHNYDGGSSPNVSNNTMIGNVVHDTGNAGILISSGSNNIAYNNISYNSTTEGIKIWLSGSGNQVYNNTIYNNSLDCVYYAQSNLTFRNNICYQNGNDAVNNNGTGLVESNNLFGTNPLFVNAPAGNFKLNPGSPAIGAGATLSAVPTDIDGVTRTVPYDIGAYETGNAPPPLPQNLQVHWPMEEGTGTTVADVTGNGHTGVFHDLPTWVSGRIGAKALHFSTAETYLLGTPLVDPVVAYTWHLWLNSDLPVSTGMQQPFLHGAGTASTDGNAVSFGFSWSHPTAGAAQACLQRAVDGGIYRAQLQGALSAGVWYHIAGSWDGTTMRCYLNGILQASTPVPSLITPQGNIGVGKTFVGSMDDVYIYSKWLTDSEILAAASAGATSVRHRNVRQ